MLAQFYLQENVTHAMATLTSLAAWQQCGRIGQRLPHTMTLARVLRRGAVNKDAQQRADSRWWVGGTSCCQQPMRRELRQQLSSQSQATEQKRSLKIPSPLISSHIHWENTKKQQLWNINYYFYFYHFIYLTGNRNKKNRQKTQDVFHCSFLSFIVRMWNCTD